MSWHEEHPDPFKAGLSAAIAEDHDTARAALWRVVSGDPRREVAWQWLAKVAENSGEAQYCLARALALNPSSERTRSTLMATQAEPEVSGKPEPRGACALCELPWAEPPRRCVRCRAVQDLAEPEVFLSPLDVEAPLLRSAVRRLQKRPDLSAGELRVLVLGLLNLGDLLEATAQLRLLAGRAPEDEQVRALTVTLGGLVDSIETDSGFETDVFDRPTHEELGLA